VIDSTVMTMYIAACVGGEQDAVSDSDRLVVDTSQSDRVQDASTRSEQLDRIEAMSVILPVGSLLSSTVHFLWKIWWIKKHQMNDCQPSTVV